MGRVGRKATFRHTHSDQALDLKNPLSIDWHVFKRPGYFRLSLLKAELIHLKDSTAKFMMETTDASSCIFCLTASPFLKGVYWKRRDMISSSTVSLAREAKISVNHTAKKKKNKINKADTIRQTIVNKE